MPSILPETRYPNGRLKKPRTLEKITEAEAIYKSSRVSRICKETTINIEK